MPLPPRENPFRADRFAPGVLPWIGDIVPLVDRVCVPRARLQVLGAHGSGKSTLLVHLARRAEERGWTTCLFRGSQGLPMLPAKHGRLAVFADEAEELGRVRLALLQATCALRGASLVVTAHRDLGFDTLCARTVDAATLEHLCTRLLGEAALAPPATSELLELLQRHRGNVREVFFALYDLFADHSGKRSVPS